MVPRDGHVGDGGGDGLKQVEPLVPAVLLQGGVKGILHVPLLAHSLWCIAEVSEMKNEVSVGQDKPQLLHEVFSVASHAGVTVGNQGDAGGGRGQSAKPQLAAPVVQRLKAHHIVVCRARFKLLQNSGVEHARPVPIGVGLAHGSNRFFIRMRHCAVLHRGADLLVHGCRLWRDPRHPHFVAFVAKCKVHLLEHSGGGGQIHLTQHRRRDGVTRGERQRQQHSNNPCGQHCRSIQDHHARARSCTHAQFTRLFTRW
mmetsp:Transcript_16941/g.43256  ORF Transcript_16941/g.43256 Transcript_16941/m.43256 type:complete len:256 (-) Transcript_16941:21-788(-)